MEGVQGTYRDGRVELDASVVWPDGTRVEVALLSQDATASNLEWGIGDWPDTPENRTEILRRIDAVEPPEMSSQEEAEWQSTLDWFGDYAREAMKRDMGDAS